MFYDKLLLIANCLTDQFIVDFFLETYTSLLLLVGANLCITLALNQFEQKNFIHHFNLLVLEKLKFSSI